MIFKPTSEKMLEHLFSSDQVKNHLKIEYVGDVLNNKNGVETSPDAIVLDRRNSKKTRLLRCEFKGYVGKHAVAKDFERNGKFDIAIVWSLPEGNRNKIQQQLKAKNGCNEILVLTDHKFFQDLPDYKYQHTIKENFGDESIEWAEEFLTTGKRDFSSLFIAYIFVFGSNYQINLDSLYDYLETIIHKPEYKGIKTLLESGKGKANLVNQFTQQRGTYPLFILKKPAKNFIWNSAYNPEKMKLIIKKIEREHGGKRLPSDSEMKTIINQVKSL